MINGMVFNAHPANDMEKAVQNAMLGFMAAMASAQAEATKIAQKAGIAYARENIAKVREEKPHAYQGRKPSFTRAQFEMLRDMVTTGTFTDTAIAAATGIKRTTVINVRKDLVKAEAALARWGL